MGQTVNGLLGSKAFEEADASGRISMLNEHWDKVESVSPDELKDEVDLFRQTTVGGVESYARANGKVGTGTFTDDSLRVAKSFDNIYALLDAGAYRKDPEALQDAVAAHDALVAEIGRQKKEGFQFLEDVTKARHANVEKLENALSLDERLYGAAVSAATDARDKDVFKVDGKWSAPLTPQMITDEELNHVLPEFVERGADRMLSSLQRKYGFRLVEDQFLEQGQKTIPTVLRDLEDSGMTEGEIADAWGDFVNLNRKWEDDEYTRVLSSGQVIFNTQSTSLLTDLDKVKTSIMDAATSDYAREVALQDIDRQRHITAEQHAPGLYMIGNYTTGPSYDDAVYQGLLQDRSFADITSDYLKNNELGAAERIWLSANKGFSKVAQTLAGAAGTLGSETAARFAADVSQASGYITAGDQSMSPNTGRTMWMFQTIAEEAPSLAFQIIATRGITGAAARGALAVTGSTQSMQNAANIASMTGIIGTAAAQSAGVTLGEQYNMLLESGMDEDEAFAKARGKATKAGITTGLVVQIFGGLGKYGGLERSMHTLTMGAIRREAARRGINFEAAARKAVAASLPKQIAIGSVSEGLEEYTDQALQNFMLAEDGQTVADAWSNALEAGYAGTLLGAVATASVEGIYFRRRSQDIIDRERRSKKAREKALEEENEFALRESYGATVSGDMLDRTAEVAPDDDNIGLASMSADEVWQDDDGKIVGLFNDRGAKAAKAWVNGEWKDVSRAKGTLNAMRTDLARNGFYPMMQNANAASEVNNGRPFKKYDDAVDFLVANELDAAEHEIVQGPDGFIARRRASFVTFDRQRGKQLAQQELNARAARERAVAEREDRRLQRAINEAQAPLTGSSLEQTEDLKRTAEKVFAPKFTEAKQTLQAKIDAEGVPGALEGVKVDPENYISDHEQEAARFLIQSGVVNMAQVVAAINSPELASAEGTFPNALRNALNVIIQSKYTRQISPPRQVEGGRPAETDPRVTGEAIDLREGPTDTDRYLAALNSSLESALSMTPEQRAEIAERSRAMIPPTIKEDIAVAEAEAAAEEDAEAAPERTPEQIAEEGRQFLEQRGAEPAPVDPTRTTEQIAEEGQQFLEQRSDQELEDATIVAASELRHVDRKKHAKKINAAIKAGKIEGAEPVKLNAGTAALLDHIAKNDRFLDPEDRLVKPEAPAAPETPAAVPTAEPAPEAGALQLSPQQAGEFNARNNEQIRVAKDGNFYGKSGIPKRFFKLELTEEEVQDLEEWIGDKEAALENYSDKPNVDPNVETARQDEIDLANDMLQAHSDLRLAEDEDVEPDQEGFADLKEQRKAQKGLKFEDLFDFIIGKAAMVDPKWTIKQRLQFHAYNQNGEGGRKRRNDEIIHQAIEEGRMKTGMSLAYGYGNGFYIEKLREEAGKGRTTAISAQVTIRLLSEENDTVEAAIKDALDPDKSNVDTSTDETAPAATDPNQAAPPGVSSNVVDASQEVAAQPQKGVESAAADQDRGVAGKPAEEVNESVSREAIQEANDTAKQGFVEAKVDLEELTEQAEINEEITSGEANHLYQKIAEVPEGDVEGLALLKNLLNTFKEESIFIGEDEDWNLEEDMTEGAEEDMNHRYVPDVGVHPTQHSQPTEATALDSLIRQLRFNFGVKIKWVDKIPSNALGRYKRRSNVVELSRAIQVNADTPIHEVSHAFLAAARLQNPVLYNRLLSDLQRQIDNDPMLQQIRDRVIKNYPEYSERMIVEEVLATYIGENGAAQLSQEQAWRDTSNDESKSHIERGWALIRSVFRKFMQRMSVFTGLDQIGPTTRLKDIAAILVNPRTRLDLTQTLPPNIGDPRRMLKEHAIGAKLVSDFLINSLEDAGGDVRVLPTEDGFALALGNWKPLMDSVRNIGNRMLGEFTGNGRAEFVEDLKAWPKDELTEEFWGKWVQQRYRLVHMSNLGYEPTKQDMMFVAHETMSEDFIKRLYDGTATTADYERLSRIGKIHGLRAGWNTPVLVKVPETGASAMRSAMGTNAELAAAAKSGEQVKLSEDAITALIDAANIRKGVANDLRGYASDVGTDPLTAMSLLSDAFHNEAAASANLDKVRANPLAKRGYTRQDYIDNKIPVEDKIWADKQMRDYSSNSLTEANKQASIAIAEKVGFEEPDLFLRAGPGPTPASPKKRIGDGTRAGFYKAIPSSPEFRPPGGRGRLAPTVDGKPPKAFKELNHAQSFRAKVALREGISSVEMRIVRDENKGIITYHVVVPDNAGRVQAARTGVLADSTMWSEENLKDATFMPRLSTFEEIREYLVGVPVGFKRKLRRMRLRNDTDPENYSGDASNGGLDLDRQNELVDLSIAANKFQQQQARTIASSKIKAIRTKHRGAFQSDANIASPDAGKVTNLAIPPGKSPYLNDILEEAMVDTTGYAFSADQLAMIADMRAMLENMRQRMRDAKLDKKFLSTHGLEVGAFLSDPKKAGDKSWRRYFPRLVMGRLNDQGDLVEKQFIGAGSTQTEQKGMDKARMQKKDGSWKSMEEIKNDPDPRVNRIVYESDPFVAMEHFLTNSYSAIAALDLAGNLQPLEREGGRRISIDKAAVRTVPVLTGLYEDRIASHIDKELVEKSQKDPSLQALQDFAQISQSVVLGGADLAAPLTVAGRFTLQHPLKELRKGRIVGGFVDVAKVFSGSVRSDVIPAMMEVISGKIKKTTTDPSALDKMHAENLQYFTEIAILGGMLGRASDYQAQVDALRQASREVLGTRTGRKAAMDSLKFRALAWGGGLGDFHRNYSEFGKMLMWKSMRNRFVDPATGNLATDQETLTRAMEELRALDRSFGYSNDLQISAISRNQRGALRILLTAPTMYQSMMKNLTTKRGLAHSRQYMTAGLMWFVASAKAADMDDDEILRRLNPANRSFLTIDIKGPGDAPLLRLSLSNFYRSLGRTAGKQWEVVEKITRGEKIIASDLINPSADFFRSRRAPFISGVISLFTGEDFLGRPAPKAGTALGMYMPLTVNEPMGVYLDRVLGTQDFSSPETYDTVTERQAMRENAIIAFTSVLGANIYAEGDRAEIRRRRNEVFRERYGVAFDDAAEWQIPAQIQVAKEVQDELGTPYNWGGYDPKWKIKENRRYLKHFDPEIRLMIERAGLVEQISSPGAINVGKREEKNVVHLERGTLRNRIYDTSANFATEQPGGLRDILRLITEEGVPPRSQADQIKAILSASKKAVDDELKSFSGAAD